MNLNEIIKQINKTVEQATREGYTYPTQYGYMQQAHDRIIKAPGLKGHGTIRTLDEVNNFLDRKFGEKAIHMSEQEYRNEINQILDSLSDVDTYSKFQSEKRQEYIDHIEEHLGYTPSVISRMSTVEIRNAINAAWQKVHDTNGKSPDFEEYLKEELGI